MNQSEQAVVGIDETIGRMERLYRAVTGTDAPPGDAAYAPIPAEKDPTQHVEEQLNRLLEMLGGVGGGPEPAAHYSPPIAVWESDSEIVIGVDLPGVKREQVEVVTQGDAIIVSGRRPARAELRLRGAECGFGGFRRVLVVPGGLRKAEPSAEMKDGVLEIRYPKAQPSAASPKPVPVH